ncbi:hypothetical protein WBJ53_16715 [Spirosoma sp. SC4-14]|uniref:hypothetical protein n=1 Tax=Spirosoma sp. SC4-14 TaxID=3128900 RepID=UPI0030CA9CF2
MRKPVGAIVRIFVMTVTWMNSVIHRSRIGGSLPHHVRSVGEPVLKCGAPVVEPMSPACEFLKIIYMKKPDQSDQAFLLIPFSREIGSYYWLTEAP